MAPIPFNILGYRFEKGLQVFKESFDSAMVGVLRKKEAIQAELMEYKHSLDNGGKWIGERDEDGYLLWDRETLLEMDLEESAEAVVELRKAFVLAIYHYWERTIRIYCHTTEPGHPNLIDRAKENGIMIGQHLERVHLLANVLKHNSSKWGNRLIRAWPDVFSTRFQSNDQTDWSAALAITDLHVNDAFEAILNSGPRSKLNGNEPWLRRDKDKVSSAAKDAKKRNYGKAIKAT